jgi:hypothetical protein
MPGPPAATEEFAHYAWLEHTSLLLAVLCARVVKTTSFPLRLVQFPMCVKHVPNNPVLPWQVMNGRTAFATLDSQDPTEGLAHHVLLERTKSILAMLRAPIVVQGSIPRQLLLLRMCA